MVERGRQAPSRVTRSLWVIAILTAAGAVSLFIARITADLGPAAHVLSWIIAPVNWFLAAAGCARTARTARGKPVIARFWWLMSGCALTTGLGAVSNAFADGPRQVQLPLAATLFYVLSGALLVAALGSLPIPWALLGGRVTVALDLTIVLGAGATTVWFMVGETQRSPATDTPLALALSVAAVSGMFGAAKVALTGTAPIDPLAMRVLSGCTVLAGLTGGGLVVLAPQTGLSPVPVVLPVAAGGFLLAALRQRGALARPVHEERSQDRQPYSVVPYVAVGLFNVLVIIAGLRQAPNHDSLMVVSVALTGLVIARQIAAFRENASLLTRLDASLRRVQGQEHRFRAMLRHSSDIVTVMDGNGRVEYASPGVFSVLGLTPEEMVAKPPENLVHPDDLPVYAGHMRELHDRPGGIARAAARLRRTDGTYRWVEAVTSNLLHDPDVRGLVSNVRDITDARRYEEDLAYQASHDELTGLANRNLFVRGTDEALGEDRDAGEPPERTVVMLVDLDDFKSINDRLGHAVGDALLQAVGTRLRGGVRPQDTVARLGGDEFAVLLRDVEPSERMEIARRIIGELELPVRAADHDLLVRASVGIAPATAAASAAELLRRSDLAMYAAKGLGRGRCTEFDATMDERASEHARLAADLSMAIDRNEFSLVFQPIVTLPAGELAGVETLIRWTRPGQGPVSPVEFIPVAERTGLIVPLGAWILYESCQQEAAWIRDHGPAAPGRISVNVSARQLIEPDFPDVVHAALLAAGLPPQRLIVEVTETAVFDGGPALAAVAAIRALGVRVALDDFGTGHSSLGLLRTCPIDVLKVDKSFVDGVGQSIEQEAIVTSLSQIGTAMRLEVIAEGVETAGQADRLYVLGYRFAQGFHFARPLPPDEIVPRFLRPATPAVA